MDLCESAILDSTPSSDLQYYINSHTNAHISPISSSAHSAITEQTEQTNRQSLQNVSLNINTNPNVCSPLLSNESTSHSIDPLILAYDTNTPLHPDSGVVNVVHGDIVGATREIEPTSCDRHAIAEPQQTTRPIHSEVLDDFDENRRTIDQDQHDESKVCLESEHKSDTLNTHSTTTFNPGCNSLILDTSSNPDWISPTASEELKTKSPVPNSTHGGIFQVASNGSGQNNNMKIVEATPTQNIHREQLDVNNSKVPEPTTDLTQAQTRLLENVQLNQEESLRRPATQPDQPDRFYFADSVPDLVASACATFGSNCSKGCSWFPSGERLLVASEDARYRIFDMELGQDDHEMTPSTVIKETEMIYDYTWTGEQDRILSTGRYQPVHLWDTGGPVGTLIATYKCINHLDELSHAFALCMTPCGEKFMAGLKNQVRTFDLARPGRECSITITGDKTGRGQSGIISCLAASQDLKIFGAGSYSKTVGVYTLSGNLLALLSGHVGGVTQVGFSEDGRRLYSGGRKDDEIRVYDVRNLGATLHSLRREVRTNQRVQFTFAGEYVLSGGTDGAVRVWNSLGEVISGYLLHPDSVPGVSVHPRLALVATASGQRHVNCSAVENDECAPTLTENSLKVWSFSPTKR